MKRCPTCKKGFGYHGGKPAMYKFCPLCGRELQEVRQRRVSLTEEEWEEFNRWEHGIPWNTDVKVRIDDE